MLFRSSTGSRGTQPGPMLGIDGQSCMKALPRVVVAALLLMPAVVVSAWVLHRSFVVPENHIGFDPALLFWAAGLSIIQVCVGPKGLRVLGWVISILTVGVVTAAFDFNLLLEYEGAAWQRARQATNRQFRPFNNSHLFAIDAGQAQGGYNAAYTNTIAWRTPTQPLPMEHKPRAVFERLFGDGDSTDSASRLARLRKNKSILDFVASDVSRQMNQLGEGDRAKLNEFFDSIRDVETRVQKAEANATKELPTVERPVGIPQYEEHAKLMFDLLHLAFQTDTTRVSTFMLAREYSELVYTNIGVTEPHHPLTHHRGIPSRIAQAGQINVYHAKLYNHFLDRMASTPDGDGTLLDHSMLLYGAGMGDGDIHNQWNMPIAVFGGANGKIKKSGQHIRYPKGTPFSNFHVALLSMVNMPVDKFGISTQKLDLSAAGVA